jgi:hypothetical protein
VIYTGTDPILGDGHKKLPVPPISQGLYNGLHHKHILTNSFY